MSSELNQNDASEINTSDLSHLMNVDMKVRIQGDNITLLKTCMSSCVSFDNSKMSEKEKSCVNDCFYDILENKNSAILK